VRGQYFVSNLEWNRDSVTMRKIFSIPSRIVYGREIAGRTDIAKVWFALRTMKTLSIIALDLFLCSVVNAQSNQNADRAFHGVVDSSATHSLPLGKPPVVNPPAACKPGDEYFDAASQNRYSCTATNTWTQQVTAAVAGTPDPVVFDHSGNFVEDSANFVWDSTNHRLGLGNPSPADTLDLLGGKIRLNSGTKGAEAFNLSGRIGVGIPVPYFTPTTANSVIAFDVYPKGTPSNFSANTGVTWFDLCSTDVNLFGSNYECLRMGKFASGDAHISSAKGGSGVVRNLDLQINGGRVGIGTTSPAALLSVGSTSPFQVNSNGNIVKLNNVQTNFPSANVAGYLTNDGSGNFYYTPINASNSPSAPLPVAPAIGTIVRISDGAALSDCTPGSGTIARSCRWNGSAWVFSPVGAYVLSSQPGIIPANATTFAAPGISTVASSEERRQYVVAKACQISNMYMNLGEDQPATGDLVVTLRVGRDHVPPVDTSVTAIVQAGTRAGTIISDTAHTVDLAAGDLVSIKLVNAAPTAGDLLTVNFSCDY
jgi:hypothetical protein